MLVVGGKDSEMGCHSRVVASHGLGGAGVPRRRSTEEVVQEEELGRGEEDRRPGDEAVEGEEMREHDSGGVGDACELGVVAGFSGEAGEVHGQKGGVGSEEGRPEMQAAERLGEKRGAVWSAMRGNQ